MKKKKKAYVVEYNKKIVHGSTKGWKYEKS
jgi:hypothetical protein